MKLDILFNKWWAERKMKRKTEVFLYIVANYLYVGINAVSNIFISKLLGPIALGAISYFNTIDSNLNSFVLGMIRLSTEREIPQIEVDKQKQEFGEKCFTLNLLCISLFSIVYFIISYYSTEQIIQTSALWVCVLSWVKGLYDYCRVWQKSQFKVKQVSIIMIVSALLIPPAVLLGAYCYGTDGFWLGRIIVSLVSFTMLILLMPKIKLKKVNISFLKFIMTSGGPIVLFGLIQTIYQTVDKYIIMYHLNLDELGFYSLGTMAFSMMLLLPQSAIGAIFPRFVAKRDVDLTIKVKNYSYIIEYVILSFSILAYFIIPLFIDYLLLEYHKSIRVVRIFLIAFTAYSSCQLKYIDLIRKRDTQLLLLYSLYPFIISITLFIMISALSFDIEQMALLTATNFVLLSLSVSLAWGKSCKLKLNEIIIQLVMQIIPCLILFLMCYGSIRFF